MTSRKLSSLILLVLLIVAGCAGYRQTPPQAEAPGVVHIVLYWLKEAGNPAHRRAIIERAQDFRYMPGVLDLHVGAAVKSNGTIPDDSFDVGVQLRFDSIESMNRYLVDPVHVRADREVFGPLCRRVQAYDFYDR
jgi:hypothetical protein